MSWPFASKLIDFGQHIGATFVSGTSFPYAIMEHAAGAFRRDVFAEHSVGGVVAVNENHMEHPPKAALTPAMVSGAGYHRQRSHSPGVA
jgi:hypothetical protein